MSRNQAEKAKSTAQARRSAASTSCQRVIEVGPKGQAVIEAQWANPKPSPGLVELLRATR